MKALSVIFNVQPQLPRIVQNNGEHIIICNIANARITASFWMTEFASFKLHAHVTFCIHIQNVYITLSVIPIGDDEMPHPEIIGKSL